MNLAALNEGGFSGVALHRRMQRLAAIENVEPRRAEIQTALHQIAQQRTDQRGIFGRAFTQPQHGFCAVAADAQGHDHLPVLERSPIDQHCAQIQFSQRPLHQRFQLFSAGLDEVFTDRRFLHPVGIGEILHDWSIVPRR